MIVLFSVERAEKASSESTGCTVRPTIGSVKCVIS